MSNRKTFSCPMCTSTFRVDANYIQTIKAVPCFCMFCGSKGVLEQDNDLDIEELYEEAYGLDRGVLKIFIAQWGDNPKAPRTFRAYLEQILNMSIEEYKAKKVEAETLTS